MAFHFSAFNKARLTAKNTKHNHPTISGRGPQSTRCPPSHPSYKNDLLIKNKLCKSQQQAITRLSQQLHHQNENAAQLTAALQAESSKCGALQQSLAAAQCELDITSSARQLATDQVDHLSAELEHTQALLNQQDKTVQRQAEDINSLAGQVEDLTRNKQFLAKRLAIEMKDNVAMRSQLKDSEVKLGAAQVSKNHLSKQLTLLRGSIVEEVFSSNSTHLLAGFQHCDSLSRHGSEDNSSLKASVADSSRSSFSADIADCHGDLDTDSILHGGDVIAVLSIKGVTAMAAKGCDV